MVADGSAAADRERTVRIDRRGLDRWRYRCPRGHTSWSPTNSHAWCKSCRQEAENGEDVDPEHYELLDIQTGEEIGWSRIELIE